MNQKSLRFGVGITLLWLLIVALFAILGDLTFPSSLNELGDFLAGIFAPIAFFWLILGYIQQAKQLEQNTQALQQQEHALQLQIEEMRESVKQQAILASIQKHQLEAQKKAVSPIFMIENARFKNVGSPEVLILDIGFTIQNIGGVANQFSIADESNDLLFFTNQIGVNKTECIGFELYFEENIVVNLKDKQLLIKILMSYQNMYGDLISAPYTIYIKLESKERLQTCHTEPDDE